MLFCSNNKGCWCCASDKSPSSGQIDTILSLRRNGKVMEASPDIKEPTFDVINKNCSTSKKTSGRCFSGTFFAAGPQLQAKQHACCVLSLGPNRTSESHVSFLQDDHRVHPFDSTKRQDDLSLSVQEPRLSLSTKITGQ